MKIIDLKIIEKKMFTVIIIILINQIQVIMIIEKLKLNLYIKIMKKIMNLSQMLLVHYYFINL